MFPRELRQRWLNRSTNGRHVGRRGKGRQLTLENLESRTMMSASPGTLEPAFGPGIRPRAAAM